MKFTTILTRTAALVVGLIVAACAQNPVFDEGMQNLAEGRIEQGLAQLEQASKAAPRNVEYRATLLRQRELAVNQLLSQGETARMSNDLNQAEAVYRRALGIDPANSRARQGLDEITAGRRHKAVSARTGQIYRSQSG